jgi:DNA-binding transcriptional ArsR family regulator
VNVFAILIIKQVLSTPKSLSQLLKETKLPERTLRYNLRILKRNGIVKELYSFRDMRRKIFILNEPKRRENDYLENGS